MSQAFPIFFRAAEVSRDPAYPLSDPGWEYLRDLTDTWFGPLANRLGVQGGRATLEQRTNAYNGLSPDGRTVLLPVPDPGAYRPAIGGNFTTSKWVNAWLPSLDDKARAKAERLFAEAAHETATQHILPDLYQRWGKGGILKVPAESIAVLDVHKTNAAGLYYLHFPLTIATPGRGPDGRMQPLDNYPLMANQEKYSVIFVAKCVGKFHREFGLTLTPALESTGRELLQGVKTPREEQIEQNLAEKGLPHTPKTRQIAAQETHAPRDATLTMTKVLAASRAWLGAKGIDVGRMVRQAAQQAVAKTSNLARQLKAESAIRQVAKVVNERGHPVSRGEFLHLAARQALELRADTRAHAL